MAELITVARPYAQAAFALAGESNTLPVWAEMLRLASAVVQDPKVHAALDNPKLSAGDKESLFLSVCGDKLNAEGRRFMRVLVESDRIGLLPEIHQIFDTLKDAADGVARAHISSAFPVTASELAGLKGAFFRFLESGVGGALCLANHFSAGTPKRAGLEARVPSSIC